MNWYQKAFTSIYLDVYAHRDENQAAAEVAFAKDKLGIVSNDTILDLCCGAGRHSFHLAKLAKIIVAYDLSQDLLLKAIELNKLHKCSNIFWQQGDMLQLKYFETFNVVVSFFNSFGYFEDEAQNENVVERIHQALLPNGQLLLDIMSKSYIIKNLKASSEKVVNDYVVKEKRWISQNGKRVNKEVHIEKNGISMQQYCETVQLYTAEEIQNILTKKRFSITNLYGDISGEKFCEDSPRLLVVAKKSK